MPVVRSSRRTVLMLALCQALAMTGGSIVATTASIFGSMLAPDRALSTLPIAVQMTGMMMATIPAALLMARIGRRPGFWIGAGIGASEERGKVQALNDFLIFGTVALSSLASGVLLSGVGWAMVQIAIMPFVAVAAGAVLWWRQHALAAEPRYAGQ